MRRSRVTSAHWPELGSVHRWGDRRGFEYPVSAALQTAVDATSASLETLEVASVCRTEAGWNRLHVAEDFKVSWTEWMAWRPFDGKVQRCFFHWQQMYESRIAAFVQPTAFIKFNRAIK